MRPGRIIEGLWPLATVAGWTWLCRFALLPGATIPMALAQPNATSKAAGVEVRGLACVVDESSLTLAKELNPQLGKLTVLARSRPMLESLVATPVEPYSFQKEVIDAMLSLHEYPRGRQLLMVFKTDRLVRLQPGDVDAAREFWRDYYRLPGSLPNRPPVSAPAVENQPERGKEWY